MAEGEQGQASGERPVVFLTWAIILGSLALYFLEFGLPIYGKILGASAAQIGGLYSALAVTVVLLQPVAGWGLDRFGRKPFLIVGLACYTVAMVVFAVADSMLDLYLAQLARGIGASMLWVTAYTSGADLVPPDERGTVMGRVWEAMARGSMVGVIGGGVVMSLLPDETAWKVVFASYAALAAAAVCLAWAKVPETRPASPAPAEARKLSRHLPKLLIVVFITSTSLEMLRPIYLIFLQDRFTTNTMLLMLAFFPAGVVACLLPSRMGGLGDRFGRAPMMAVGLTIAAVLSTVLPLLPGLSWLIVLYTLEEIGWSMADPAEAALVSDLVGGEVRGLGYGIYTTVFWLGTAIGPLIGGWLYDTAGQTIPFYLNGGILLLGAVLVLALLGNVESPADTGQSEFDAESSRIDKTT